MKNIKALNILIILSCTGLVACGGKYLIKSYPSGAKTYIKDLQTREKKLVGVTPIQLKEQSKLGDVFFLVFEKQNYKPKEVMIRVNEGESLAVMAQLNPMNSEELEDQAAKGGKKDDPAKPQGQPQKKKEGLDERVDDLELRLALVENTVGFYKDAMFSPRFQGGVAKFDRDKNDKVIGNMFEAQRAIAQNKLDTALKHVNNALEKDEYISNAWMLKGSIKFLKRDYPGAKTAWERALKLDPHNKIAYKYLNEAYKRMGVDELPKRPTDLRVPASVLEIEKRRKLRRK